MNEHFTRDLYSQHKRSDTRAVKFVVVSLGCCSGPTTGIYFCVSRKKGKLIRLIYGAGLDSSLQSLLYKVIQFRLYLQLQQQMRVRFIQSIHTTGTTATASTSFLNPYLYRLAGNHPHRAFQTERTVNHAFKKEEERDIVRITS